MMMKLPDAILYFFKKAAQQYLSQLSCRNRTQGSSPPNPVLIDYKKLKPSICKEDGGLTQEGELKDEQIELEVVGLMLDQGTA